MKRMLMTSIVIAMGAIFSSCAAPAEKTSASQAPAVTAATETSANAEQEIRILSLEYDTAIVRHDAAAFERLFAEDARITFEGGKVYNKAQMIAKAKSGETKFEVGHSDDVNVKLYGSTAIVTGRWTEKSTTKGKPFAGTLLYTTVYMKSNETWQIVSDQVTLVTP